MKGVIIGTVLVIVVGIAFVGYQMVSGKPQQQQSYSTSQVKLSGTVQNGKGDDYDYIIISAGKSTGLASYNVKLEDYVGKNVEVTGQSSGTTLYVDQLSSL